MVTMDAEHRYGDVQVLILIVDPGEPIKHRHNNTFDQQDSTFLAKKLNIVTEERTALC